MHCWFPYALKNRSLHNFSMYLSLVLFVDEFNIIKFLLIFSSASNFFIYISISGREY